MESFSGCEQFIQRFDTAASLQDQLELFLQNDQISQFVSQASGGCHLDNV